MATVAKGPWGSQQVVQLAIPRNGEWWRRDESDQLWVWCSPALNRARVWRRAPVPMAKVTKGIPKRSPNRDRITAALDLRGMYGPEVDEALGVHNALDTVVDSWEAGSAVPTEDDVRRLATLTSFAPEWFYRGTLPIIDGPVFMCRR